jgi:hypothetical protein
MNVLKAGIEATPSRHVKKEPPSNPDLTNILTLVSSSISPSSSCWKARKSSRRCIQRSTSLSVFSLKASKRSRTEFRTPTHRSPRMGLEQLQLLRITALLRLSRRDFNRTPLRSRLRAPKKSLPNQKSWLSDVRSTGSCGSCTCVLLDGRRDLNPPEPYLAKPEETSGLRGKCTRPQVHDDVVLFAL